MTDRREGGGEDGWLWTVVVGAVILIVILGYLVSGPARAQSEDIIAMHEEMLYTVVQVAHGNSRGSGTVIYSETDEDGDWQTYILTNYHVVESAIKVVEEWDSAEGEEVKRERREPVNVLFHQYRDWSHFVGTSGRIGDIVAAHKRADLAVVRLIDTGAGADNVADMIAEDAPLAMGETVWAVGGGLGQPPFMTSGILGHMHQRIDGYTYNLATAPIIFGNSGGALFRMGEDSYELVGIPSRVSAAWGSGAITHMGWSIQMETVRQFLRDNDMGFLVGDDDSAPAESDGDLADEHAAD